MKFASRLYIKIIMIIIVIGVAVGVGIVIRSYFVERDKAKLTKSYKVEKQAALSKIIDSTLEPVDILARDYSMWDEMITAVNRGDRTWLSENIAPALTTYKSSAAWVLDKQYNLKYQVADRENNVILPLPFDFKKNRELLKQNNYFVDYFTTYEKNIYKISIAPLQPTNDTKRQTEPQGYLVVAKKLDNDYFQDLSRLSKTEVEPQLNKSGPEVDQPDAGIVRYAHNLRGLGGDIEPYLQITSRSDFLKALNDMQQQQYWLYVASFVFSTIVYSVIIFIVVIMPLRDVSDAIRYRGGKHLEKVEKRNDEIGDIARLVRANIEQNEELELAYEKRKQADKQAQQRLADIERVNNLMVGRELRIAELKRENAELKKRHQGESHNEK